MATTRPATLSPHGMRWPSGTVGGLAGGGDENQLAAAVVQQHDRALLGPEQIDGRGHAPPGPHPAEPWRTTAISLTFRAASRALFSFVRVSEVGLLRDA